MSDLFGVPLQNGGLMGLMTNPQSAGLLGMASGLLQASGPSRLPVSMGQAMGAGLQGMQQGSINALNTQRQMMQMQALQGLMGMQAPGSGSAGQASGGGAPSYSSFFGTSTPTAAQMPPAPAPSAAPQSGASIFGRSPQQLWNQGLLMNMAGIQGGSELMSEALKYDPTLAAQMPTDITKMGVQGGMTPEQIQAANAAGVAKANYIAPVNARPGSILRDPLTMQPMAFNPNMPAGTTPMFDASGNVVGANLIPGVTGAVGATAAAKAAGEGSMLPYAGVDAQGNPLPVTNRTAAATQGGGVPTLQGIFQQQESSGGRTAPDNPYQIQQDTFNQYAQQGESWSNPSDRSAVAQRVLAMYNQKYGGDLGRIATAYFSGEGNVAPAGSPTPFIKNLSDSSGKTVAAYVGDILGRAGGSGFGREPQSGGSGGGPIYAAPPLGATNAANASQGAPSKQMADSQDALASQDANYQQSRASLLKMLSITQNGGLGDTVARLLPENLATRVSNDAAEYQKAHANYVSLQGKALGSGGTDASRAMLDEAVPTFEKPQAAKISGLTDQLNQLDLAHLKRQTLTPTYQQGNEKAYTDLSAQFDKAVTPAMMPKLMPILSMPASPARTQALQQAIRDPQMKAALDLMVRTGQLK
jgi:hypothetical protein